MAHKKPAKTEYILIGWNERYCEPDFYHVFKTRAYALAQAEYLTIGNGRVYVEVFRGKSIYKKRSSKL